MHWRTYERLRRDADDAAQEACALFLERYGHDPANRRLISSMMDFDKVASRQRRLIGGLIAIFSSFCQSNQAFA